MPDINIPDAAVEAAAEVIGDWDGLPNRPEAWRHDARTLLKAAAPHIAAQALREAAEAVHPFHPVGGHTPVTRDGLYDWLRDRADQIEATNG